MPITTNSGQNFGIGQGASLLAGGLGGLFPAAGQTSTGTHNEDSTVINNSNTNSFQQLESLLRTISQLSNSSTATTSSTPTLGGPQQALLDQLTQKYANRQNVNLEPYAGQQIQQINKNADLQSTAVNNIMAARGVANSPVAATSEANVQGNRIGQISQFESTLPLLQRQLEDQGLAAGTQFLSSVPRAMSTTQIGQSTQTGDTSQTGHNTTEGSVNYGGIQQGSSSGGSTQTTKPTGSGGIGGLIQGLVPILLSMFA